MSKVPALRVEAANEVDVAAKGRYVLYWMTAARRPRSSFGLDRALARCRELDLPLLVLEALRVDYPWASARLHRFVLDGMRDNARAFAKAGVRYHPYVEPEAGAGRGLLAALAERAAVVVTDRYPTFFLPRMVAAAAKTLSVRLEVVDSCGLLPLALSEKEAPTAYVFRRFLQRHLPDHLEKVPSPRPLAGPEPSARAVVAREVLERWPAAPKALLEGDFDALADLPVDAEVGPVETPGGAEAGRRTLRRFVRHRLSRYAEEAKHPDAEATSGLSPYLHFGHVGPHEVLRAVAGHKDWSLDDLSATVDGRRQGWWGMGESAEAFLDQVVTWRELGFHFCRHRPDHDRFASLPPWARETLARHAGDVRTHVYDRAAFEAAATHDEVWNAAQRQLREEGAIHNYLRMLWGKKILEWSESPEAAWETMVALNDRWALDGRDPNSYSGIGWCLGRFDRPWAPEREVFGRVRFMSSASTVRKLRLREYLERYGAGGGRGEGSLFPS